MILEDLICTNIMQRGVGNVNPMKMAKCIQELERIKGIRKGNNQFNGSEIISEAIKTQANLASEIGLDERQLRNYKQLNDLIPELQQMIENGSMKATVGYKIWSKIAKDNQLSGLKNQSSFDQQKSNDKMDTNKQIADDLDMSKETFRKSQFVKENADEDMIKQLDDGELSINKAYNTLKYKLQEQLISL